ncbi:unnamed protein product [Rhizopus stolonifer]
MSCISSRFRCIGTRYSLTRHTRYFTTVTPCRQTQEILPEERLKELVAELEKPLKTEDNTTVLLEAIESLQPKSKILPDKEYEKLYNRLDKSYNRKQLAEYLASKEMYEAVKSKSTKKSMIGFILQNTWSIKTVGQLRDEKRRRVTQQFPATRQELFFIIGDNGNTIRNIETKNEVNITIDVSKNQYLVEGQPLAVEKAKKDIFSHLNIIEGHIQVPKEMIENEHFRSEISRVLTDVSKVSGSYILLNADKFVFSSLSQASMDNAKRLLSLTLTDLKMTNQRPLDQADRTVVQNGSEFSLIPFHDTHAMSVYNRQFGWSRLLGKNTGSNELKFTDLANQNFVTLNDIKNTLLSGFDEKEHENISLEARFGHLLCRNSTEHRMTPNLLKPISTSNLGYATLADIYKNSRTHFFNAMPPFQLMSEFSPLALGKEFYQRSIRLEYVNNSLLVNNFQQDRVNLNRLELEFNVEEDGNMKLKSIMGEKKRSVVDILGISGHLDARLVAKQLVKYSEEDMQELLEKCNLLGYTELQTPIHYTDMTLLDISYLNKKRYMYDSNLISVNRVEEQDNKSKRTEIQLSSVDPKTLDVFNSTKRWDSFSSCLIDISNKWKI